MYIFWFFRFVKVKFKENVINWVEGLVYLILCLIRFKLGKVNKCYWLKVLGEVYF